MFPAPVLEALRMTPGRTAIEHGGREITCGELLTTVARMAAGLRAAGLGPGDGVALLTGTNPDAYAAHLAAHALGCRVAAFRPRWSAAQIADALGHRVDALIVEPGASPGPLDVPILDTATLRSHPAEPLTSSARPDDIARVTFTSGSTDRPKGCAQTYRAFSTAYQRDDWPPQLAALMTAFQRCLVYESLASPVMMTYLGRCLVAGGTAIMTDENLTPALLERHRVTATMMPAPRLQVLLATQHYHPADLTALRAVVLNGTPADPGLLAAAIDRLGPIIWQGYGKAESGLIAMLTPTDIATCPDALTTVGRPLPTVTLSIRDHSGQIWVRTPHMMSMYWNNPSQTAEAVQDGWLHTRDTGYLGPDGLLRLTSGETIPITAETCYPTTIERLLTTHPSVSQAYVTTTPDSTIHAFVVPTPGHQIDDQALQSLITSSLSASHTPQTITVLTTVPTTPAGKPDTRALATLLPLLTP
ncbi:AMP-dependent synthetase [Acrocarpospora corrugata]|uniref:AMP-dependent synthetase n=1 Tax=Acrocarpospora corrugata TaxID=35763 RepID=A0A5M3W9H6_9ACTN|nr:AMP-binding protein [Acrocarpospora corrugata]GES05524.1 AMP-dependent synthetase [Acrocarpospora corrugata]